MSCASESPCSVTTTPCGSWLPEYTSALLSRISAPNPGANNAHSIAVWCSYENTRAGYNALAAGWQVTGDCGCFNCPNNHVCCYCDATQGGQAGGANLLAYSEYAPIVSALRQDLPVTDWPCVPGLIAGIDFWGTGDFGSYLSSIGCQSSSSSSSSPSSSSSSSSSSSGPPPAPPPTYPAPSSDLGPVLVIGGLAVLGAVWLRSHPGFLERHIPTRQGVSFGSFSHPPRS